MDAISSGTALQFGVYRDGDNNLDAIQAVTIAQAAATSARDSSVAFNVEDTTSRRGVEPQGVLRTERYDISGGDISHVTVERPHDMSSRANLADFVARTLDEAQVHHATSTWLDLIDHGGGDGGGLQADHGVGIMAADDIAGAIADGIAMHAKAHPEDAGRAVDGVVANQCLMSTLAFASGLEHAGVRYLAASPETMLAPGVPTGVASDIAAHVGDPAAMANAVVARTMNTRYDVGGAVTFGPAAAFDVLDLAPDKIAAMTGAVHDLNASLATAAKSAVERAAIRSDAQSVRGMVRFPDGADLPWRADRPAVALYQKFAHDARLDANLREKAATAAAKIGNLVLAHGESGRFAPFDGASYRDAVGPNVHFPTNRGQIDPWAPKMRETDNDFYRQVGQGAVTRAVA